MKRTYLGEFEEIVLLSVAVMDGKAYGFALMHEILERTGRETRLNQIHSALLRLEEKRMVKSVFGDPTPERGGKRKKLFSATAYGYRTLEEIQQVRTSFWSNLVNPFKLSVSE